LKKYYKYSTRIILVIILILTTSVIVNAQEAEEKPGPGQTILNDFGKVGRDLLHVFGNIKDFDSQDALIYTGVIAGSAACMPFDEDFRDFMLNNRSSAADKYFDFHNELGSLQGMGIIVGSTYLTGLVFDSDKLRGTGRLMFEALLLSGIYTHTLKITFGRSRPYNEEGACSYKWFETKNMYYSFPSGHSTGVFSMATVFALRYDKWWSYAVGYSLAAGTAFARPYKDQHWLSDIFAGACIGTLSGIAVVKADEYFNNKSKQDQASKSFSFQILPTGINLNYKF
jgi:membrane-associated phospholipid phosphatase